MEMQLHNNKKLENTENIESAHDSPTIGLLVILISFLVGLSLTAALFFHFTNSDNERIEERLLRGTQTLAAYASFTDPDSVMIESQVVLQKIQQDVTSAAGITQESLENYLWTPAPPAMGSVSLRYMPKVSYNQEFGKFEMIDVSGVVRDFNVPILDAAPKGVQTTTIGRDEYYPILLVASRGQNTGVNVLGLNHFFDSSFHIAMDQARDSGGLTARTSFPLAGGAEPFLISYYFYPLYLPGELPNTVDERRNRHIGFVAVTAFVPAADFIDFLPESYLGLDAVFAFETEAFLPDNQDAEFKEILASGQLKMESFETAAGRTNIFVRPSLSFIILMQTTNRWWALSIGLILTAWVSSMLLWSRRKSIKMAKVIAVRTNDLAQQTRNLSEANAALSQSESRYRMLADHVSDVIYTHDLESICTYISPSITQQNGFAVEDYIGLPIYSHMPEASAKNVKNAISKAKTLPRDFDETQVYQFETYCKDGSIKILESTVTLIPGEDGLAIGYLGVSRDITDRIEAECEKSTLEEVFHQSQKMEAIGTLAGGIAHDFNNILMGILGHAELMKVDMERNLDTSESLNTIEKAAMRAKELTNQLLGFARKGQLQSKPVDVNSVVDEVVSLIVRTIDKSIIVSRRTLEPTPIVNGDAGQISQVLLNLAVNARDAMPNGGELVFETKILNMDESFCQNYSEMTPGMYACISVSDTGSGMPKDKLSRIFEPFFSDKDEGKGTGLGLAMVYGVTKNHGGAVSVHSEEGIGSIFDVYLPLSEDSRKVEASESSSSVLIEGIGTILLVDDEEVIRNLSKKLLQKLGYKVLLAEDGSRALEFYQRNWKQIDFVIMDMIMPNMGGLECLQKMEELNPNFKAVLSTGYSPDSVIEKSIDGKQFEVLQKPFRLQELSELVAKYI